MSDIQVVPISVDDNGIIHFLCENIDRILDIPVEAGDELSQYMDSYNPDRDQYHSSKLLLQLLDSYPADGTKVLGVTSLDLFVPILTYLFGEAQLDGTAAVVSLFRLRPEFYGLPHDKNLLKDRLLKESVHEIGHTFGLLHCPRYDCVMHPSTYAEDIDFKPETFCSSCDNVFLSKKNEIPSFKTAAVG